MKINRIAFATATASVSVMTYLVGTKILLERISYHIQQLKYLHYLYDLSLLKSTPQEAFTETSLIFLWTFLMGYLFAVIYNFFNQEKL